MKKLLIAFLSTITMLVASAQGQGFINLDFEAANLPAIGYVAATNALPGWTAFQGTNQLFRIPYNLIGIASAVELWSGSAVLNGNFDLLLTRSGSISQTGLVPANAKSLLFDAVILNNSPPLAVSMDGQNLSYMAIANATNSHGYSYTVYGADISAWAGQAATLAFSGAPALDGIQFSSQPIPEPSGLSLIFLGGGVFIYVRARHRHPAQTS